MRLQACCSCPEALPAVICMLLFFLFFLYRAACVCSIIHHSSGHVIEWPFGCHLCGRLGDSPDESIAWRDMACDSESTRLCTDREALRGWLSALPGNQWTAGGEMLKCRHRAEGKCDLSGVLVEFKKMHKCTEIHRHRFAFSHLFSQMSWTEMCTQTHTHNHTFLHFPRYIANGFVHRNTHTYIHTVIHNNTLRMFCQHPEGPLLPGILITPVPPEKAVWKPQTSLNKDKENKWC